MGYRNHNSERGLNECTTIDNYIQENQPNFTNHPSQNSEQQKRLSTALHENFVTQVDNLDLSAMWVAQLPDSFKQFIWLKKLNLATVKLLSLKNIPENVIELVLRKNEISELKEGDIHENVRALDLCENKLKNLNGIPKNIQRLNISENLFYDFKGEDLDFSNFEDLTELGLNDCKLKKLPKLPKNITKLYLKKNFLGKEQLDFTMYEKLEKLVLEDNSISEVPKLPKNIEEVDLSDNDIKKITDDMFPEKIASISIDRNKLVFIGKLPANLKSFSAKNNMQLKLVSSLPEGLSHVDFTNCNIKWLPTLPNSLVMGDFSHNSIIGFRNLNNIPPNLHNLDLRWNPFSNLCKENRDQLVALKSDPRFDVNIDDNNGNNFENARMKMFHENMMRIHGMKGDNRPVSKFNKNDPNYIVLTKKKTI